jgi:hypothetical protein
MIAASASDFPIASGTLIASIALITRIASGVSVAKSATAHAHVFAVELSCSSRARQILSSAGTDGHCSAAIAR